MAYQSAEMSYKPSNTPYFTVQPMKQEAPAPTPVAALPVPQPSGLDPKLRISLISGLVFLIIASPQLYKATQYLLGRLFTVASPIGCPTVAGLLLHTAVFVLVVYGLMFVRL